jgi:hypothetical protein
MFKPMCHSVLCPGFRLDHSEGVVPVVVFAVRTPSQHTRTFTRTLTASTLQSSSCRSTSGVRPNALPPARSLRCGNTHNHRARLAGKTGLRSGGVRGGTPVVLETRQKSRNRTRSSLAKATELESPTIHTTPTALQTLGYGFVYFFGNQRLEVLLPSDHRRGN